MNLKIRVNWNFFDKYIKNSKCGENLFFFNFISFIFKKILPVSNNKIRLIIGI